MAGGGVETTTGDSTGPTLVIEAGRQGIIPLLKESWRYRELLLFLSWRDVSIRYKQALLGVLWVVLQPAVMMIVFTLFNRLAKIDSGGFPYPLFVLAGIIPWAFFAEGIKRSSDSIVTNTSLVTKVYFPRIIIPAAASLSAVVDFLISLFILGAIMAFYRFSPGLEVLALPLFMALIFMMATSFGMIFSATNVRFRDVKYTTGFLLQMWMFASPVLYPYHEVTEKFEFLGGLLILNPMVGIIEGFRWSLLGAPFPGVELAFSCAIGLVMLLSGVAYFRRVERTFADVI